jgi:hypothetical protein
LDVIFHKFLSGADNLILYIFEWLTKNYVLIALEYFLSRRLILTDELQSYASAYEDEWAEDPE